VGIIRSQPVEESAVSGIDAMPETGQLPVPSSPLLNGLWRESGAAAYGLEKEEFNRILHRVGTEQDYGLEPGATASRRQQAGFFRGLRLADLTLARACASGHEGAWEHFIAVYRQPLFRAAIAITRSETLGRELADQLYAELYGLSARDGVRRSPLDSYKGKGSLMGWLRTTLAQRHVDHHRRTRRELPLDNLAEGNEPPAADPKPGKLPAELLPWSGFCWPPTISMGEPCWRSPLCFMSTRRRSAASCTDWSMASESRSSKACWGMG
jgi:RNA polymerase sigma-70 factor (ECF subfamily)